MNDSGDWEVFEPETYEITRYLGEEGINKVIENLKQAQVQETEINFQFKYEHDLKAFMKVYEEQVLEEEMMSYYQDDEQRQANKFRKIDGINLGDYEVQQLRFPTFQFLKVFVKFYETRLRQIQTEYHYKLQTHGFYLRVYYPKNDKISSFFKNQIFQMKTKLVLRFSNDPNVIKKVKHSAHFAKIMEQHQIAAIYKISYENLEVAIFYSNVHKTQEIQEFISKHMSEHTTVIDLFDKKLKKQVNRSIFKLVASFLGQTLKNIQKEQDIIVEANFQSCCFLVHDRHECFVDAKNEIMERISELMYFRLEGKDMRSIFNKVIKNHNIHPYLRVRYSKRALYCVLSYGILHQRHKKNEHIGSFCELFKGFFENLNQENIVTYFLKNLSYPKFINKVMQLTQMSNVNVENFDIMMLDDRVEFSRVVLGVKALVGMASVVETRKYFYEVFLKLTLREEFEANFLRTMKISADSFSNIMGLSKPSTILPLENVENMSMSEEEVNRELKELLEGEEGETEDSRMDESVEGSIEGKEVEQKQGLKKKYERRERKSKHVDLGYVYKEAVEYKQMERFWQATTRESKLERALIKGVETFGKSKFKAYLLGMKQVKKVRLQEIEQGRIYLSTIIERGNKVSHHMIDLEELKKKEKDGKMKQLFVFYKVKNQEVYLPSYVLEFIQ